MKDIMKQKLSQILQFIKVKRNYIVTAFIVVVFACMSFSVSYGYFSDENTSSVLDGKVYNFEEKNKTLKFYIETGYQTGVYVLSSNIPSDGYTYNSSKSTYNCTNALSPARCAKTILSNLESGDTNVFLMTGVTGSLYFDAKEDTKKNADITINLYKKPNSSGCGNQCYYKKTSYTMHELATQGYYYVSSSCTNGATISKIDVDAGIIEIDTSSKTECNINFDYGNFAGTILENNNVITTSTTLESRGVAKNYEGLLKIEDDFGDSYIFRGGQPDNYVKLYDKYWRILRINGNGTVRLIYWGTSTSRTSYVTMPYNTSSVKGKGDYLGSLIKSISASEASGNFTTDSVFCNDKQEYSDFARTSSIVSDDTTTTIYYGSLNPLYLNDIKSLACGRIEDAYTTGQMYQLSSIDALVDVKNNSVGNYDLSSPYGLITAAEYLLAGGGYTEEHSNNQFYLYNIGWTMSPAMYTDSTTRVYYIKEALFTQSTNVVASVHPVISLKGDTKVTGSGTASDPYIPVES